MNKNDKTAIDLYKRNEQSILTLNTIIQNGLLVIFNLLTSGSNLTQANMPAIQMVSTLINTLQNLAASGTVVTPDIPPVTAPTIPAIPATPPVSPVPPVVSPTPPVVSPPVVTPPAPTGP